MPRVKLPKYRRKFISVEDRQEYEEARHPDRPDHSEAVMTAERWARWKEYTAYCKRHSRRMHEDKAWSVKYPLLTAKQFWFLRFDTKSSRSLIDWSKLDIGMVFDTAEFETGRAVSRPISQRVRERQAYNPQLRIWARNLAMGKPVPLLSIPPRQRKRAKSRPSDQRQKLLDAIARLPTGGVEELIDRPVG